VPSWDVHAHSSMRPWMPFRQCRATYRAAFCRRRRHPMIRCAPVEAPARQRGWRREQAPSWRGGGDAAPIARSDRTRAESLKSWRRESEPRAGAVAPRLLPVVAAPRPSRAPSRAIATSMSSSDPVAENAMRTAALGRRESPFVRSEESGGSRPAVARRFARARESGRGLSDVPGRINVPTWTRLSVAFAIAE
jgi:hypothetical protein